MIQHDEKEIEINKGFAFPAVTPFLISGPRLGEAPVQEPPNEPKAPPVKEPIDPFKKPPPPDGPPVEEPWDVPPKPPVKEPPPKDPHQTPPQSPAIRLIHNRLVINTADTP